MADAHELGIIGESKEDGLPVIFKFVDELPSLEIRERFRWLTVISWKYDRNVRNGMPPESVREHPRYPLEVEFYEDQDWADFEKLRGWFKRN